MIDVLYEVTTDCLDFNHRYHKKGERVIVPDGQPVPKWFKPIGKLRCKKIHEEYKTLNQMKKDELLELAGKEGVSVLSGLQQR